MSGTASIAHAPCWLGIQAPARWDTCSTIRVDADDGGRTIAIHRPECLVIPADGRISGGMVPRHGAGLSESAVPFIAESIIASSEMML